jgi:hypothetical protein
MLIQIRLIVRDDIRRLELSWTRSCHRPDGDSYPHHAYGCERIPESVSLRGIFVSSARHTLMTRIKIARGTPGSYPPGPGPRGPGPTQLSPDSPFGIDSGFQFKFQFESHDNLFLLLCIAVIRPPVAQPRYDSSLRLSDQALYVQVDELFDSS